MLKETQGDTKLRFEHSLFLDHISKFELAGLVKIENVDDVMVILESFKVNGNQYFLDEDLEDVKEAIIIDTQTEEQPFSVDTAFRYGAIIMALRHPRKINSKKISFRKLN